MTSFFFFITINNSTDLENVNVVLYGFVMQGVQVSADWLMFQEKDVQN